MYIFFDYSIFLPDWFLLLQQMTVFPAKEGSFDFAMLSKRFLTGFRKDSWQTAAAYIAAPSPWHTEY